MIRAALRASGLGDGDAEEVSAVHTGPRSTSNVFRSSLVGYMRAPFPTSLWWEPVPPPASLQYSCLVALLLRIHCVVNVGGTFVFFDIPTIDDAVRVQRQLLRTNARAMATVLRIQTLPLSS